MDYAVASHQPPRGEDKPDQERHWYVIHTYSGYENKVKKNLEHRVAALDLTDHIFQIVVPTEKEVEIKDGQRRTVERKVYPGYVLVEMVMSDESWYVVRNTPGVTSFVGMGNKPVPLEEAEAQKILHHMTEEEAPKLKTAFVPGMAVRIKEGPFAEFEGTVESVQPDKERVRVLINIFGRETPTDFDFLQVEKLLT
jgi:transcription termination/antitermination protein NusG